MEHAKWKEVQSRVIARAWKDEDFQKRLLKEPLEVLREWGIELPENVDLTCLQEEANHLYFVVPSAPSNVNKLSERELQQMAAGEQRTEEVCRIATQLVGIFGLKCH